MDVILRRDKKYWVYAGKDDSFVKFDVSGEEIYKEYEQIRMLTEVDTEELVAEKILAKKN